MTPININTEPIKNKIHPLNSAGTKIAPNNANKPKNMPLPSLKITPTSTISMGFVSLLMTLYTPIELRVLSKILLWHLASNPAKVPIRT